LSALLMRLLHITGGAVAVAGGIIPAILAINMVAGPGKKAVEEIQSRKDPNHLAVYPLAVPYRLNPVGLIIASGRGRLNRERRTGFGACVISAGI
jgi:small neutral amino acid transporter SnatA (MarC family)